MSYVFALAWMVVAVFTGSPHALIIANIFLGVAMLERKIDSSRNV